MTLVESKFKLVCWEMLYNLSGVNLAYNIFIEKFTIIFNNCCCLRTLHVKCNHVKTWFTSGLRNA